MSYWEVVGQVLGILGTICAVIIGIVLLLFSFAVAVNAGSNNEKIDAPWYWRVLCALFVCAVAVLGFSWLAWVLSP